jgi:hypothetical protein
MAEGSVYWVTIGFSENFKSGTVHIDPKYVDLYTLHCTALHRTALHRTALHCTAQVAQFGSVLTTVWVALERYLGACHPHRWAQRVKPSATLLHCTQLLYCVTSTALHTGTTPTKKYILS